MPQRMYKICDPALGEYIFNVMMSVPKQYIRELDPTEIGYFKNEQTVRNFADNQTLEKRLLLLARLGIEFCVIMAPERTIGLAEIFKEVVDEYEPAEKRRKVVEAMAAKKIFVISSNDILMNSHMAAQNSHSQVYILNRDYVKLHHKLNTRFGVTLSFELEEAKKAFDDLAKITLAALSTSYEGELNAICGVGEFKLRILLALFPNRFTLMDVNKIIQDMNVTVRTTGVKNAMSELVNEGMVQMAPSIDKVKRPGKSYMIVGKGIDAVVKYLKYIHKQTE